MDSIWTESLVTRVVDLHNQGLSAGQTAKGIGASVTRNSILSKLNRIKRDNPQLLVCTHATRVETYNAKSHAAKKPALRIVQNVDEPEPEPMGPLNDFPDRINNSCRYLHGDPSDGDWRICGHQTKQNSPYCVFHHKKTHQPFIGGAKLSEQDRLKLAQVTFSTGAHRIFG
jgi:GcrA cell cycle regulator